MRPYFAFKPHLGLVSQVSLLLIWDVIIVTMYLCMPGDQLPMAPRVSWASGFRLSLPKAEASANRLRRRQQDVTRASPVVDTCFIRSRVFMVSRLKRGALAQLN